VLLAAVFGIAFAALVFLDIPLLVTMGGALLMIAVDKAQRHRERICAETGSKVRPPRWFVLFWWVIIAVEFGRFIACFVQGWRATGTY